jgi:hypothetical protein
VTCDRRHGWQFREGLPTIPEINGEAVLRENRQRRRIGVQAEIRFPSHPLGGNGGQAGRGPACARCPFGLAFALDTTTPGVG